MEVRNITNKLKVKENTVEIRKNKTCEIKKRRKFTEGFIATKEYFRECVPYLKEYIIPS